MDEKKFCKHCGERLTEYRPILSYNEYTGSAIYGPMIKECKFPGCTAVQYCRKKAKTWQGS